MRKIILIILFVVIWSGVIAQKNSNYNSIDKLMLQIPESMTGSTKEIAGYINSTFSTADDKSRAIFIWIVTNIRYDIANMFMVRANLSSSEIAARTLKARKGVCINYAELFNEIANMVGVKSYVITGYTKQNGVVDILPHAWCAAQIDSTWFMFDPTWGSGVIQNGKYLKQINNTFYKIKPEVMIQSHIPFDPMWQFLGYPITNQEFYDNKTQLDAKKPYFNFKDSLAIYDHQTDNERLISSSNRIEKNGVKNSMIFDQLQYNRREIAYNQNKQFETKYNLAIESYNNGVNLLNKFVSYYNKQFTPKKSDQEIQQMVDTAGTCFNNTREYLNEIKNPDANTVPLIRQLNKSVEDASASLEEKKVFLKKYFNTTKLFRKALFYKYTFAGMPIN